ncbi:hypothetical protein GUJ93_ZPchr0007g3392 [Zizania palustris]|uniref:Uncharacterized protein n=1 Tax=Zizania palustris TaxID=103762 RepID=A0A8J5T6C6_ZIZPA|nr:hypothetical protein GUJ93_ZPchr0007g3392 [Zizania palustris]
MFKIQTSGASSGFAECFEHGKKWNISKHAGGGVAAVDRGRTRVVGLLVLPEKTHQEQTKTLRVERHGVIDPDGAQDGKRASNGRRLACSERKAWSVVMRRQVFQTAPERTTDLNGSRRRIWMTR